MAFSIEQTVRALDVPEENIATLLCYLELHEKKYVGLLNVFYYLHCKNLFTFEHTRVAESRLYRLQSHIIWWSLTNT